MKINQKSDILSNSTRFHYLVEIISDLILLNFFIELCILECNLLRFHLCIDENIFKLELTTETKLIENEDFRPKGPV